MKGTKKTAQIRITADAAKRIDEVVAQKPVYAHRQHFVRVAVEELLQKVERQIEGEKAA